MASDKLHFYGQIQKFEVVDNDSLMVSGIASSEAIDADGESVTAEAMRKAIPSYLLSGTVREMHQPIAAGRPISAFVDEDGKTHFTAKIVDKGTIQKIKEGVLKGFSIGGKCLKRVGNQITELLLKEISVVDLPNNPEARFEIVKFDKPDEKCNDKDCKTHTESDDEKTKSEKQKRMNEEALKKLDSITSAQDSLTKTVEALAKTVEALSKSAPDIAKVQADLGDLQKKASDTQKALIESEKSAVIAKMKNEGRVALNPDTKVAYKADELEKMDLPLLKVLAANSPVLPTEAKAVYKGETKEDNSNLKGSDRVLKAWGSKYADLEAMKSASVIA